MDIAKANIILKSVAMMAETVLNLILSTLTVLEIVLLFLEMGFVMALYITSKSVVTMVEIVLNSIINTPNVM